MVKMVTTMHACRTTRRLCVPATRSATDRSPSISTAKSFVYSSVLSARVSRDTSNRTDITETWMMSIPYKCRLYRKSREITKHFFDTPKTVCTTKRNWQNGFKMVLKLFCFSFISLCWQFNMTCTAYWLQHWLNRFGPVGASLQSIGCMPTLSVTVVY